MFMHTHVGYTHVFMHTLHDSPLTPPMQQDGATSLLVASLEGHKDIVLALLQAGASVDAKAMVRVVLVSPL